MQLIALVALLVSVAACNPNRKYKIGLYVRGSSEESRIATFDSDYLDLAKDNCQSSIADYEAHTPAGVGQMHCAEL